MSNTGIWISVLRIEYQFLVSDLYDTEKLIYCYIIAIFHIVLNS